MSEPNSNLFRDDPAAYYTELGAKAERERIMELLKANQVLRLDALGSLVFVNCDTLAVEYLPSSLIEVTE